MLFLVDNGVRHACVPLPTRLLNISFNIHIFIPYGIRSILNPRDVVMNDVEVLEVIVLILKIILIRGVEGLCFVIACCVSLREWYESKLVPKKRT